MADTGMAPVVERSHGEGAGGARLAAAGAGGMAVSFVVVAALVSLPFWRIVAVVVAALMVLLAAGLWLRVPAFVALGLVFGGLTVFAATSTLLAAGDDVYEQVPGALDAVVPSLGLGFGAAVLVGSAASIGRVGRVGQVVAVVVLALGLVLGGAGVWQLLQPRDPPAPYAGFGPGCGSVFRPVPATGASGACWEVLLPARSEGRRLLGVGTALALFGLGVLSSQFGRRAWAGAAVALGLTALGTAWWTSSMPLQSIACGPLNESYTGPVCDGLRQALTWVSGSFAVLGSLLVVMGLVRVLQTIVRSAGPLPPQVSA